MAELKCEKCGKEFSNERGLKIHMGIQHGSKKKGRPAGRKKTAAAKGKGKFACEICGRSFKMAMHLARHTAAAHGKTGRKAAKKVRQRVVRKQTAVRKTGVRTGVDVDALSIDQLLALKNAVDDRVRSIAQKIRQVKA